MCFLKSDFKEPVCECDPSQCGTWNNDYCTEAGDINAVNVCGACQCDQKQGLQCQCSKEGGGTEEQKEKCLAGGRECSGHGSCHCGECSANCFQGLDFRTETFQPVVRFKIL